MIATLESPQLIMPVQRIKIPAADRSFFQHPIWVILNFTVMLAIITAGIYEGMKIRRDAWEATTDVHFRMSLQNAIVWGHDTNKRGILNVYQIIMDRYGDDLQQKPDDAPIALDYPPLRLYIMSRWAAWGEQVEQAADQQAMIDTHIKKHQPAVLTPFDKVRLEQNQYWRDDRPQWHNTYEFNRPVLLLNNGCELAGAVGMFLLVHLWLRRCSGAPAKPWLQPLRGTWPALFSALLLWFSPAVIFNAHCYEQWDAWILPPFLFAIYFGLLDKWLISGILIGIVSLGKGQILMVVPAIAMWQLFMFKPNAVIRMLIGIALASGIVASPWLVSTPLAFRWICCLVFGVFCLSALFFFRGGSEGTLAIQFVVLLGSAWVILWPWSYKPYPEHAPVACIAFIALAAAARFLPRRWIPTWAAAAIAGGLYACVPLFKTSMAWYTIGIEFPAHHWQDLVWTKAVNLGALLSTQFHWDFSDVIRLSDYASFLQIPSPSLVHKMIVAALMLLAIVCASGIWRSRRLCDKWIFGAAALGFMIALNPSTVNRLTSNASDFLVENEVFPMRYLMMAAYLLSIVFCAVGMARHTRGKDRMLFFSLVAPWVLMYTLLPQMTSRYLVWGAAFSAATASFSLDGFLLFLLINAINVADTSIYMFDLSRNTPTSRKWQPIMDHVYPNLSWAVLLIAAIYLYKALRRSRRVSSPSAGPLPPLLVPVAVHSIESGSLVLDRKKSGRDWKLEVVE